MLRLRSLPHLVLLALVACVAGLFATVSTPSSVSTRLVSQAHPTNAAKVFRWGLSAWEDEFKQHLSRVWKVNHPGLVDNQHGMLTLNATAHSGTVRATVRGHAHRYGRWEARVRSNEWSRGHTPYHVIWELVPVGAGRCGSRDIVLSDYTPHANHVSAYLRNRHTEFSAGVTRNMYYQFHTYAIEVTKHRISWFVDTHVIRTERRPAAMTGARYRIRFVIKAAHGATMNPSRMQMDWVRYYTLKRPDARSTKAPPMRRSSVRSAC